MKNVFWILLGVVGLTALILLTREDNPIPHSTMQIDTMDYKVGIKGEESGEAPVMG